MMNSRGQLSKALRESLKEKKFSSCIQELHGLATHNDVAALIAMAHIYFYGGGGVKKDYSVALIWLNKIKLKDDITGHAAHCLGIIYYKGLSVSSSHRQAFKYFRSAALHGNRISLLMVAAMQKEGDGTLKKLRTSKIIFSSSFRDKKLSISMRIFALLWVCPLMKRWASWQ